MTPNGIARTRSVPGNQCSCYGLSVTLIGTATAPPGLCHVGDVPQPQSQSDDQLLGVLYRPSNGIELLLDPSEHELPWLISKGIGWSVAVPPSGLGLVREFAALDAFELPALAAFANRWGFLAEPDYRDALSAANQVAGWGESWNDWWTEIGWIREFLALHNAVAALRSLEDVRARTYLMGLLEPKVTLKTRLSPKRGLVRFHAGSLFLGGPEELRSAGLDAIVPSRTALVRFGQQVFAHFFRQRARGYIYVDLSEPPAPRLRPTFNRLRGALYLALAESAAAPPRPHRRCLYCGQPMSYERSSKLYCSDSCKHRHHRKVSKRIASRGARKT